MVTNYEKRKKKSFFTKRAIRRLFKIPLLFKSNITTTATNTDDATSTNTATTTNVTNPMTTTATSDNRNNHRK